MPYACWLSKCAHVHSIQLSSVLFDLLWRCFVPTGDCLSPKIASMSLITSFTNSDNSKFGIVRYFSKMLVKTPGIVPTRVKTTIINRYFELPNPIRNIINDAIIVLCLNLSYNIICCNISTKTQLCHSQIWYSCVKINEVTTMFALAVVRFHITLTSIE